MAETPFIIQEHQFNRIKIILARLCVECAARVVFLVDRDGQPIAFHGDIGDMDTTSFSSLAAGNFAGSFPVPIVVVPGNLTIDDLKAMA